MTKKTTGFSLSPELLEKIDSERKQIPRSAFVESALREFLRMKARVV